jgi:hypothetical protein
MANTKRKPEETPKRSPGKSKFVFPKREAPPVDNTYFDRLYSELQEQKPDSDMPASVGEVAIFEEPNESLGEEALNEHAVLNVDQDLDLSHVAEISAAVPLDKERIHISESPGDEAHNQDLISEPNRLELAPERVESTQLASTIISPEGENIWAAHEKTLSVYCKPETSSYVDRLKLKYRLSKGEANVFRYLLGASHDKGQGECYITIPKLAETACLTTRGCQLALKSLQMRGFIVRTEEYDPTNRLGIKIHVNLISL